MAFQAKSGPSLFTPSTITGCALWLDAADPATISLSGSTVTQWNDKSGNGRNTTTVGGSPAYSSNAVQLNGTSSYLLGPYINTGTTTTAFVVANANIAGITAAGRLISFGSTAANDYNNVNYYSILRLSGSNVGGLRWQNVQTLVTVTTNTRFLLAQQYDGTNGSVFLNGTAGPTAASSGSFNTSSYSIGRDVGNTDGSPPNYSYTYWNGSINETVVYNTSLTTSQRQQVEGYLAWKWGLQTSLPTTHPYYSAPVYAVPPFPLVPIVRTGTATLGLLTSPTQITGCAIWFDGADPNGTGILPTNGATISTWVDKSGNSKNATGVSGPVFSLSSLNNLGTLRFNGATGTASFLDTPSFDFGTSQRSVFFIARNTGPASGSASIPIWLWPQTGNGTNSLSFDAWIRANVQGGAFGPSTTLNKNQYYIVSYRFGSTSAFEELFANGSLAATNTKTVGGSSYANATSGYRLGYLSGASDTTYAVDGNMGELILFNRAVSTSQQQQVEGYLAWKWGLQASLPTTHPYSPTTFLRLPTFAPSLNRATNQTFSPRQISGCQLWLDMADKQNTTNAGGFMTSIQNKSSNAISITQVNPPYLTNMANGLPGVNFTGSQWFRGNFPSTYTGSNIFTFAVGSLNSTALTYARLVSLSVQNSFDYDSLTRCAPILRNTTLQGITSYRNNTQLATVSTLPYDTVSILESEFTGSLNNIYINGSLGNSVASSGSFGFSNFGIGYLADYGGTTDAAYWRGNCGEVIIYYGALTIAQRQQVEGYLAWKWGLQANLPSSHPYKLFPPPP